MKTANQEDTSNYSDLSQEKDTVEVYMAQESMRKQGLANQTSRPAHKFVTLESPLANVNSGPLGLAQGMRLDV